MTFIAFKFKFKSSKSKVNDAKSTGHNLSISQSINIICKCNINKGNVIVAQLIAMAYIILSAKQTQMPQSCHPHCYSPQEMSSYT